MAEHGVGILGAVIGFGGTQIGCRWKVSEDEELIGPKSSNISLSRNSESLHLVAILSA
jgi:hypothetical protein